MEGALVAPVRRRRVPPLPPGAGVCAGTKIDPPAVDGGRIAGTALRRGRLEKAGPGQLLGAGQGVSNNFKNKFLIR